MDSNHTHHYLLASPSPGVETVQGVCKGCGAVRFFLAYEEVNYNPSKDGKRKWPVKMVKPAETVTVW